MNEFKNHKAKPFLRWAGGKTRSIPFLDKQLPPNFSSKNTYYEPFLGAGSLFFHLKYSRAVLSDTNRDLIECYQAIQKRPDLILRYLKKYSANTCEDYYYEMRDKYNKVSKPSIARAALFIYLNKTCFNGIYRVNKKGVFNVPYGFKEPPYLPSTEEINNIHVALSNIQLFHGDYKEITKSAKKGDFVYFDPPYPPINGTSYFTHYTKDRFTEEDHAELALLAEELTLRGCYVLISNAEKPYIRSLYKDNFNIFEHKVTRWIRTDGKRYKVSEIAITNYNI